MPGHSRLRHWPPLEAKSFDLPSLVEVIIFVRSDATGLLQLEHAILDVMLNTSAVWHKSRNNLHLSKRSDAYQDFKARRCFIS